MHLRQFKNLIENSNESAISLNHDVAYEEIFDDFCENDNDISINPNKDLIIDGNDYVIDVKSHGLYFKMQHRNITFKNIHFKNIGLMEFSGKNSPVSFEKCKFTHSNIHYRSNLLNIMDCTFEKSIIQSKGYAVLKNTVFKDNDESFLFGAIRADNIKINDCVFKNNQGVLNIRNYGEIKDSTFKNNRNLIDSSLHSQTVIENTTFEENHGANLIHCMGALDLKNCAFKNNEATYRFIYSSGPEDFNIIDCAFDENISKQYSQISKKGGCLKLKNCSFKGKESRIIFCSGELSLTECKFKKHHKINNINAFEISKKESEFLEGETDGF